MRSWKVDDVMTKAVVSVLETASYRSIVDLLISRRFSAVPVVDEDQRVAGLVSEADLLRKIEYGGSEEPRLFEGRHRRTERSKSLAGIAADLMSSPPIVVASGTPIAVAARLMHAEDVKRLPVVDDQGRLIGMVSRGDLLKVHLRSDDEIHRDIVAGILTAFPGDTWAAVTAEVNRGVVTLSGRVDRWTTADLTVRLTRQIAGVAVVVTDNLEYSLDDRTDERRSATGDHYPPR